MIEIMKSRFLDESIEPGLIPIFQLFLVIQLVLTAFNVLAHTHLGRLTGCPLCIVGVGATGILILLGYLSSKGLQRLLGRYYLPLALAFSIFLSLLVQAELLRRAIDPNEFISTESAWQIFLFLFFPLVLVAWQYNFVAVILYCLFSGVLEILMLHFADYASIFANTDYPRVSFLRAIAFLVSGYVISRVMTIQKRQRQELVEANRRLGHYAATLEQLATTQERNRMAWELHDTLAHTLSGLAVQLEAADSLWDSTPAHARALLEEALDSTRHGLTETRKAIQALRASPLEDLGLSLAIRDLAENAASRAGAMLELNLPPTLKKLSPNIEQCFYRVAQEALENAVRHAGASLIAVDLVKQDGVLALTVTDDGQGFEIKSVNLQHHFGLSGMHERAEMIGGNLEIISLPGKGVRIKLTTGLD